MKQDMRFICATDAKQNFAALLDDVQRGPVVIRRQSRHQAVVISPQECARLHGLAVASEIKSIEVTPFRVCLRMPSS
jgi:prevent-host-death family protein